MVEWRVVDLVMDLWVQYKMWNFMSECQLLTHSGQLSYINYLYTFVRECFVCFVVFIDGRHASSKLRRSQ
jgi:hypothetical protein